MLDVSRLLLDTLDMSTSDFPPAAEDAHSKTSGIIIASALNEHMPVFQKPDIKFSGLITLYQATENNAEN